MAQFTVPIVVQKPLEHSQRVKDAQWTLSGHNVFGIRTYFGAIDGIAGPATLAAAKKMKYRIGYKLGEMYASYGQVLYEYLVGKRKRTSIMAARAKARQVVRPKRAYPVIGRRGSVIGYPGQGTHSFRAPPNNWQSDRAYDIALPYGTPLCAVEGGVIGSRWGSLNSTNPRMLGKRIYVENYTNQIYYAHCSTLVKRPGQVVKPGDLIAYSGAANGVNHLHIACRYGVPSAVLLSGTVISKALGFAALAVDVDEEDYPAQLPANWHPTDFFWDDDMEAVDPEADEMVPVDELAA